MTTITNENIRHFVRLYLDKKRSKLPPDLRNVPIGNWDVSNVTDMSQLFFNEWHFNEPLNWNVSNVTNMDSMFKACFSLNQPLNWDVRNVENMEQMFSHCEKFNQDLSNWNVSKVETMYGMFFGCDTFNQDLSDWDVSNVTNYKGMFTDCPISKQNKPIFGNKRKKLQRLQREEEKQTEQKAYEFIPKISQSRNLPEQISNEITSFLTKDKQSTINDKLLKLNGLTNKHTNTIIEEEPDVKTGIGGKKRKKSQKRRKTKRKSKRKTRKNSK